MARVRWDNFGDEVKKLLKEKGALSAREMSDALEIPYKKFAPGLSDHYEKWGLSRHRATRGEGKQATRVYLYSASARKPKANISAAQIIAERDARIAYLEGLLCEFQLDMKRPASDMQRRKPFWKFWL